MLGSDRHSALALLFHGDDTALNMLRDEDIEGVKWAHDYILAMAPTADYPILNEKWIRIMRGGISILDGTADAICGDHVFDLKWRERDYDAQMAAYALGVMQMRNTQEATVHILFGESKQVKRYSITRSEAEAIVCSIVDYVMAPDTICKPSEYCSWCRHVSACPILTGKANAVGTALQVYTVESLGVATADNVSMTLNLAEAVTVWAVAVKEKAKELAFSGMEIPGYVVREKSGNREIAPEHINAAFGLLDIPVDQFMQACKVSITNLESILSDVHGLTKKDAKETLNTKLYGIIETKPSVKMLVKSKE